MQSRHPSRDTSRSRSPEEKFTNLSDKNRIDFSVGVDRRYNGRLTIAKAITLSRKKKKGLDLRLSLVPCR